MKRKITGSVEYEVIETIAEGGMGTVLKALKKGAEGFEKVVAIKTLLNCYSTDKKFVRKFIEEAKLVADLVHENIVQIYQLDHNKDEYYFVLEFVDGISLYNFMEFHKKLKSTLPQKLCVFITARIARGLAYAHSRCDNEGKALNIVHCDVCPHNILINTEGLPKLTDFGIARAVNVTEDDSVSGKLPFMSPEQANKRKVDFRSDIYSLGTVLFYMLSGGYTSRRLDVKLKEILEQARNNYIDWDRIPEDTDEEIVKMLRKMMATDPADRYQNTSELARELEYHIYKDGYGPTIVTLANYMRSEMPALFTAPCIEEAPDIIGKTTRIEIQRPTKTVVLPNNYFENESDNATKKTVALPKEYYEDTNPTD
ncbi:MAG: serine/threonine protein kinase [Lentisphaerae bacterium]|nr:serine/threonine protein kinase [Lentisphaerota bacterium]MCP4102011.1 serine/threonine protein kinase [Lentisphaerota bacterium]